MSRMRFSKLQRNVLAWLLMVEGIGQGRLRLIVNAHRKGEIRLEDLVHHPREVIKLLHYEKAEESVNKLLKEYTPTQAGEWLVGRNIQVLHESDNAYPSLLKQIYQPPVILFVKGKLDASWWELPVAVVGSRQMTDYGQLVTRKIVRDLVELGSCVVSGGMYGVDLMAHQVAVENKGKTVILLGHGFNHIYPSWIGGKHQAILDGGGAIISQFSPFATPTKGSFVARNRLVAGMSQAVVVVEAAAKSGTHITVEFALEEGRDVCAVPGPMGSPYSQGTKWLINQGARLVTSGAEVISPDSSYDFPGVAKKPVSFKPSATKKRKKANPKEQASVPQKILKLLKLQPLTPDMVFELMNLKKQAPAVTLSQVLIELTQLEMMGKTTRYGGYYRAVSQKLPCV